MLQVGEPFPPAEEADAEGLVAVGGRLETARVLSAYRNGIFPWPLLGADSQVLWFSPDPRFVVEPSEVHIGRSLRRLLERGCFRVTCDQRFDEVIASCAEIQRKGQVGTWITPDLQRVFRRLHQLGFAHSVEVWQLGGREGDGGTNRATLAGGLYGLSLGRVFFGESMFSQASNASKIAFVRLSQRLAAAGYALIDCQQETGHLARLGARQIQRSTFVERVRAHVDEQALTDPWAETEWT